MSARELVQMFDEISFPSTSRDLFDLILTLGWYDGITSGLAKNAAKSYACRFDLLTWGPGQDRRIFVLGRLEKSHFDEAVSLMSTKEPPVWPRWTARWPANEAEAKRLSDELDRILMQAGNVDFVLESDSMFERIFALKRVEPDASKLLPEHFDGEPYSDNYEYWHRYLGLAS